MVKMTSFFWVVTQCRPVGRYTAVDLIFTVLILLLYYYNVAFCPRKQYSNVIKK